MKQVVPSASPGDIKMALMSTARDVVGGTHVQSGGGHPQRPAGRVWTGRCDRDRTCRRHGGDHAALHIFPHGNDRPERGAQFGRDCRLLRGFRERCRRDQPAGCRLPPRIRRRSSPCTGRGAAEPSEAYPPRGRWPRPASWREFMAQAPRESKSTAQPAGESDKTKAAAEERSAAKSAGGRTAQEDSAKSDTPPGAWQPRSHHPISQKRRRRHRRCSKRPRSLRRRQRQSRCRSMWSS